MEIGDIVYHRATEERMVVIGYGGKTIKCRYKNTATGLYETQEFLEKELMTKKEKDEPVELNINIVDAEK